MGTWDVDGLLGRIPARLFAEWQAYYRQEPFGAERDNLHAALIAKMVYDVAVKPEDRDRIKVEDLMLAEPGGHTPKSPEELYATLRAAVTGTMPGADLQGSADAD